MAEYYPLLARAVATLHDAPAEKRRAIYDRARGALLGQLRSMQAVPPEAIERESLALDEAIARLEAEMPGAAPPATVPSPTLAAPPSTDRMPAPPAPAADPTPLPPAVAVAPAPSTPSPAPAEMPTAPTRAAAPPPRPAEPADDPVADRPGGAPATPVAQPRVPSAAVPEPPMPVVAVPAAVEAPSVAPPVSVPIPAIDPPAGPPSPLQSRPPGAPRPMAAPPRSTVARPAAEALTRIIADKGPEPPVLRVPRQDEEGRGRTQGITRVAAALPSAPKLQIQNFSDAVIAAGTEAAEAREQEADTPAGRDDVMRPAAPRPIVRERFNPRFVILAAIGLLVVAGIAYTAWRLRDKPEALARSRAALAAAEQAASQQAGKISNRAEGGAAAGASPSAPASAPAATSTSTVGSATQSSAAATAAALSPETSPAVTPTGPAVAATGPSPAPASPGAPAQVAQQATPDGTSDAAAASPAIPPAAADVGIPVAQRAAFLIDAPDEASKIKTYVGTVVWRPESVGSGQNQPLAQAVRAEVDIPDLGLKLAMLFQKNFEPQFPASHTLDLRFSPSPSNPIGNVKQINVPQMRKDDAPSGDSLIGLPVTITENYFLVGLSRGDATARNLELIATRNWFDIPLLMTSGKVAKITFEKGGTGQKIIDAVVQSWQ